MRPVGLLYATIELIADASVCPALSTLAVSVVELSGRLSAANCIAAPDGLAATRPVHIAMALATRPIHFTGAAVIVRMAILLDAMNWLSRNRQSAINSEHVANEVAAAHSEGGGTGQSWVMGYITARGRFIDTRGRSRTPANVSRRKRRSQAPHCRNPREPVRAGTC